MNLAVNDQLHGFVVTRIRAVEELSATLVEMTHTKTGAELCWVDNQQPNKLFSVAFKTLPEDSTGVFHILEHSVLCGSKKYPVREPFVELLKSSMNTFLNAMTFPDKTMYPVSSRNEQDYLNLMSVYLDAVFAPRLEENPSIFYQEGWHIELNDGVPSYKGVVFNEMKGAMSSVNRIAAQGLHELLFPDNCYRFNSGGDPVVIPTLTYEQFLQSYHRYYHPSNARFFLDGAVPLEKTLEMINEYLDQFDSTIELPEIVLQEPKSAERTDYYEIAANEDPANKAYFALGKIIGTWKDKRKILAADMLCSVLTGSNEAPLKRAILSAGLGQDIEMGVQDGTAQAWLMLQVQNTEDSKVEQIQAVIRETVEKILAEGINRGELTAYLNRMAFMIRQPQEPQGLMRAINALSGWLYGDDPLPYMTYNEDLAALREMIENGGFEELLRELMLDETGLVKLHVLPSATLGEEKRKAEAERLAATQASWTPEEEAVLLENNAKLEAWQQTPDTAEQLATLPVLSLSEVDPNPEIIPTCVKSEDSITVVTHTMPCRGIVHMTFYFALTDCTKEELTKLSMLPSLLGKLATAQHNGLLLQQEVRTYIGKLNFEVLAFAPIAETETCAPYLAVHCSVLEENLEKAQELILEILTQTNFDQPDRIKETVLQTVEEQKQSGIMGGHVLGRGSVLAQTSARGAVEEAISGHTRGEWLRQFAQDFDAEFPAFLALLNRVKGNSFCKSRLTIGITAGEELLPTAVLAGLPVGTPVAAAAAYHTDVPANRGIRIPAQIGFAVKGIKTEYTGSVRVAAKILSLSYLWNMVRVQGGAYGAGLVSNRSGNLFYYSYRDPSPARSMKIYGESAAFLREFCGSEEELDKFIISTIADTEPLLDAGSLGDRATAEWFCGIDAEFLRKERKGILGATKDALLRWCDTLEAAEATAAVCVVAHEAALNDCSDLEVVDL